MTDDEITGEPDEGFNPAAFFDMLRKSASVKAGAVMFGEAQVAYYNSLIAGGMDEKLAYNTLADTTGKMITGIVRAAPPIMSILVSSWERADARRDAIKDEKQVPGE